MPRYSAMYRNPMTGRTRLEICHALSYWAAIEKLPRWIYPDPNNKLGSRMRRQGSITTYKQE